MSEPRLAGVSRVLITEDELRARIVELAAELDREYANDVPIIVGVLNGAFLFMADLIREMKIPLEVDFMAVSSYGNSTRSSGVVQIIKDLSNSIEGRRVIVLEDVVDSGLTLKYLIQNLSSRNPADLKVVVLLSKWALGTAPVQHDLVGFVIPDEFVVGYGLDLAGRYRNVPFIGVYDPASVSGPAGE
jgi:hypoxanthine phosphoribosyltransferase